VENASRKYPQPTDTPPCAIACLDCLGDTRRLDLYRDYPQQVAAGKFVVLTKYSRSELR